MRRGAGFNLCHDYVKDRETGTWRNHRHRRPLHWCCLLPLRTHRAMTLSVRRGERRSGDAFSTVALCDGCRYPVSRPHQWDGGPSLFRGACRSTWTCKGREDCKFLETPDALIPGHPPPRHSCTDNNWAQWQCVASRLQWEILDRVDKNPTVVHPASAPPCFLTRPPGGELLDYKGAVDWIMRNASDVAIGRSLSSGKIPPPEYARGVRIAPVGAPCRHLHAQSLLLVR